MSTNDVTPATPSIMGLIDHSVSNYADFSYGSTLHDDAPGIVFTTIPGATYSMYDNGALIGTMVATKTNTNWTVPSVLFNGAHELTLMATDAAGNNSAQASINFTVAAGPAAPAYLGLI
ncbi:Ig-like domain-containing protein, partial [Caballeronia sordidicola]